MFRIFCTSAVYSSTSHVSILTALTFGCNQQVITWRSVQFFTRTTRLHLRFPLPLPRNKNDSNNSPPHGPKGQACPMGFQGMGAEEGGWQQANWTMRPHESFLLGDKETTAFHSDYSFFGTEAFEGNGCKYMNGTQEGEGRRPFTHSYSSHLFLFSLCSSPSNACHTDISNLGIHVF